MPIGLAKSGYGRVQLRRELRALHRMVGLFVNKLDECGEAWVVAFVSDDLFVNIGAECGEVVSEGDLFGNMVVVFGSWWLGDYEAGKGETKPELIVFTCGGHRDYSNALFVSMLAEDLFVNMAVVCVEGDFKKWGLFVFDEWGRPGCWTG